MKRLLTVVMSTIFLLVTGPGALAEESDWPRTLPLDNGSMTIYPLQVDEMNGDVIEFRAALAYRETADSEPVFGAGWFESQVEIDSVKGMVHPTDLKVTETRFPAGTDNLQNEFSAALARESSGWNLDFSTAQLQAALKQAEAETLSLQQLNNAPPTIIYRDHPALLVSLDGDPVLREIENSKFQAVINTPYPLIYDGKRYYLNAAKDVWYRADSATGPYQFDPRPPADIAALVQPDEDAADPGVSDNSGTAEPITAANAPEIVVSTEPAELIVTEGPAAFVPLVDDLLVLQNSDDDVFMHVGSQQYYVVLAGRWYHSKSLNGPWEFRASDALPAAFANIPPDSDQADSRVHVAGTEEAREAVLDAQVPQTAAVQRGEVDFDVEYDGQPEFEQVDGTDMQYAENTGSTVIESNGLYYLVEDGVWYVSVSPDGPWQVADYRPQQVAAIMPTSPVYNVKYVHVYDSTPSVVYVGYTPGYLGSYVHFNTIYYGTGWYYRPWVSPYYYYPRPSTWGWNVSYNSWSGWNFGFAWGWGPFNVHYYSGGYWHHNHYWHHRHYSRWGPRGYRPRHYARNSYHSGRGHGGYGRGNYGRSDNGRGNNGRGGQNYDGDGRGRDGQNAGSRQRNDNLYRDSGQRALIADTRDNQRRTPGSGGSSDGMQRVAYTPPSSATSGKSSNKNPPRNQTEPVVSRDVNVAPAVRDQQSRSKNPSSRSRIEPVAVSELGHKARERDRQVAGKNRNSRDQIEPVRVADLSNKAQVRDQGKNRNSRDQVEPVRVADLSNKARVRDQAVDGNKSRSRNRTEPVRTVDTVRSAERSSNRVVKQPSNTNRTEPVGNKTKAPRTPVTPAPARTRTEVVSNGNRVVREGTTRRNSRPQSTLSPQVTQNSNAPIPLPQYRTRNNRQQRSVEGSASSGPRQTGNRQSAPTQSAPRTSGTRSAPTPAAAPRGGPQTRIQRSGGQRGNSQSRGSSRRTGGNNRR